MWPVRADGGAPESAIADQEGDRREDLRGMADFCAAKRRIFCALREATSGDAQLASRAHAVVV